MTTTADKIARIMDDFNRLRDRVDEELDKLDARLQEIAFTAEPAPPDPEPLECWARIDENGKPVSLGFNNPAPGSRYVIRFCQVTPGMLENEKDAARYRYLKNKDMMPFGKPETWDEIIDKELEKDQP